MHTKFTLQSNTSTVSSKFSFSVVLFVLAMQTVVSGRLLVPGMGFVKILAMVMLLNGIDIFLELLNFSGTRCTSDREHLFTLSINVQDLDR